MTRLLTNHICTMTELREPQKVLDRAGGELIAVLKNSRIAAYFVPQEFVESNEITSMDMLLKNLGANRAIATKHNLDDRTIIAAIPSVKTAERLHEHLDCIRISFEWLDAQTKLKRAGGNSIELKHMIENWGGRYVSQSDVEVAAFLHPGVTGMYPTFNLSAQLIEPSIERLNSIPEAMTQLRYRERHDSVDYKKTE